GGPASCRQCWAGSATPSCSPITSRGSRPRSSTRCASSKGTSGAAMRGQPATISRPTSTSIGSSQSDRSANPMHEHDHDHDHDDDDHAHPHAPPQQDHYAGPAGAYEVLEEAIRSLLIEKGVLTAQEIAAQVDVMDSRSPALG